MAIEWVKKTSTVEKRNGIQWTLWNQLDFADDFALLSHTQQKMQENTITVAEKQGKKGKSKVLKVNTTNTSTIMLEGELLEEVDDFTYLGSIVNNQGGTNADVKARIGKARTAFLQLKNIWRSRNLSIKTKISVFNTNMKSVLLFGSEKWRTTITTTKRIQILINICLRRIL